MYNRIRSLGVALIALFGLACKERPEEETLVRPTLMESMLPGGALGMKARELHRLRPKIVKDDFSTWESLSNRESIRYWFDNAHSGEVSHSGETLAAVRREVSRAGTSNEVRDLTIHQWQRLEGAPVDTISGCVRLVDGEDHFVRVFVWRGLGWVAAIEELYSGISSDGLQTVQLLRMSVQRSSVPLDTTLPGAKALRATSPQMMHCKV